MSRESTRESRINTLKETQESRKQDSLSRVYQAIERLQKIDAKINFATVAKEAGLSVSYLYKYPELKQQIGELRAKQNSLPVTPVAKPNSSATGKIIAALRERNAKLEEENKSLKHKNEALAGQVYRLHYLEAQVERQGETIERLEEALKQTRETSRQEKVIPIAGRGAGTGTGERVARELEAAGIQLNATLAKTIKAAEEETVLNAIQAYKEAIVVGNIERPGGWLKRAIEEGWKPNDSVQAKTELEIFKEWYPLAREKGVVLASQQGKNGIEVYTPENGWKPLSDLLSEYPLANLQ